MTTSLRRLSGPWLFALAPKLLAPASVLGGMALLSAASLSAATETKITFDVPAGEAAQTLKVFAQQAQREIIFSTKSVSGVRTNAVKGELTMREALAALLAGTKLTVFEDEKTGSLAIEQADDPQRRARGVPTALAAPAAAPAIAPAAPASEETVELAEFVVTGVFTRTKKMDVTASVSTVNMAQLAKIVPVSAADLLWSVPSVYVNSSLGEIRNVVYSRGVSANTSNGDLGYYYVSMQEDGLPVTNVGYSNWGPDYFLRPDAMLERVEAVRGGSASITSANAPGGVFNYISRKGADTFLGEARVRVGLEGEDNPYYRTDLWVGGPGPKGTTYSLGGFFRSSDGARNPGYRMNEGGQLRFNLRKDYGAGSITLHAKYLNDHNGWFEFYPAKDFNDPRIAAGIDRFATNLHRPGKFSYVTGGIDQKREFDPESLAHSVQKSVGVEWTHDFGDGWIVSNHFKVSDSTTRWNTSASVALRDITRGSLFSNLNSLSTGPNRVPAGEWIFKDRKTGQVMARILSSGTNSGTGGAGSAGLKVLENNLPRQDLQTGAVWSNNGLVFDRYAKEAMNQFTVNKRIGGHLFTAGSFYAYSDAANFNTTAGRTVSPVVSNPEPLDVALITAAGSPYGAGQTLQITNPQGFAAEGSGFTLNEFLQKQLSLFFGHNWEIGKKLTLDWGVRYEDLAVSGLNNLGTQVAGGNYDPAFGGADGNPLTIYDNRFNVRNPVDWVYDRSLDSVSWSGALNYTINPSNSVYVRYTKGEKAPDLSFFTGLTNAFAIANFATTPQTIEQWEVGYKVRHGAFNAVITPFFSKLGDVLNNPLTGTNTDNTTYSLQPLYSAVETYGVELETNYAFTPHLSVRGVVTWQQAEATKWQFWNTGSNGPADDFIVDIGGKDADNNPDWIVNLTPEYQRGRFTGNVSWKYMGARPANIANMFTLPAYDQTDLFLSWAFSGRFSISLNVNNVFDGEGVMNWAGYGDAGSQFNRQNFTTRPADPNTTFLIVPIQPRAIFFSATYKF